MWDYPNQRRFLGYQCEASFAIESADLDDVQQLLIDLVAAGTIEIEAVEFDVRAKPEPRAEARRQAVAAARRKADLYAEAAGIRVGVVLHIDDVDPDSPGNQFYRGHGSYTGATSAEDLALGARRGLRLRRPRLLHLSGLTQPEQTNAVRGCAGCGYDRDRSPGPSHLPRDEHRYL